MDVYTDPIVKPSHTTETQVDLHYHIKGTSKKSTSVESLWTLTESLDLIFSITPTRVPKPVPGGPSSYGPTTHVTTVYPRSGVRVLPRGNLNRMDRPLTFM